MALTKEQQDAAAFAMQSHHEARTSARALHAAGGRTALLASSVAAEIAREIEDARSSAAINEPKAIAESLTRIELLCFALVGADK